jgi:hypothetical protein
MLIMSTLDLKKTVHIIVHGQTNLVGTVKEKLIGLGFSENSLLQASLDKVGNEGDYVALAWPPMTAKQIILNEITGIREDAKEGLGMGAWAKVEQRELSRIPLT